MAADTFQIKRGTTAAVNAYLPAVGEPVYDITLKQLKIGDGVTLGGVATANALTADELTTARDISLTGSVTGTVSFDGSANVSMATSVGASLQASLDLKAPLASPTFTGVPVVPTAAVDTNTTQAASTAFVVGQAGSATPIVDGTGTVGTSLRYSRQDHIHPTDTSRAPLASPTFTGVPAAPTPAVGTNTTQLATTAMVQAEIANKRTWTSYTPTITATTGTFTTTSSTGKHMVVHGICHFQVTITITVVGTGTKPVFTLPFTALTGSINMPFPASALNAKVGAAQILTGLATAQCVDSTNGDLVTGDGSLIFINGSYPVA